MLIRSVSSDRIGIFLPAQFTSIETDNLMRPPGFFISPSPSRIEISDVKTGLRGVVAIPVKDEAERIAPCLEALAVAHRSCDPPDEPSFGVVLLLNNCTDESAEIVRSLSPTLPFPTHILEQEFPAAQAHAGSARRAAMDAAAHWLEICGKTDGIILTTDADSRVPRDWIQANFRAIERGAEAVAGMIVLDADDERKLSVGLRRRGDLEATYETLLEELSAELDPVAYDPWPRHPTNSRASFALTVASYRKVGGLLAVPLGEDKALAAQLFAHDVRLRHDPGIVVVTSGRLVGRANGGVADTIALRMAVPETECDEYLEPVVSATVRAMWRKNIREMHQEAQLQMIDWPSQLGIDPGAVRDLFDEAYFGRLWQRIEQLSPKLSRQRLRPRELPDEIAKAKILCGLLALHSGPEHPGDTCSYGSAALARKPRGRLSRRFRQPHRP
jgi:hypothetical protein